MTSFLRFIILCLGFILAISCQKQESKPHQLNAGLEKEILELSNLDGSQNGLETEEQINNCKQAIDLARTLKNDELELKCLIQLSTIQINNEYFKEALNTGNLALNLALKLNDHQAKANIHKLLGKNYYHLASFHKAFESFEISLGEYKQLKDTINMVDVLNMQGNVFFAWKDYDQAESYYQECLKLGKQTGQNTVIAKSLTNLGIIYAASSTEFNISKDSSKFLLDKAIQHVENALVFLENSDNKLMKAEILNNLSQIYDSNKEMDLAIERVKLAREISQPISHRIYINSTLTYAALLYSLDSLEEAKELALSVKELALEKGFNTQLASIDQYLSSVAEREGDYKTAFEMQKSYAAITDSIFNLDYKRKIDAIKMDSEMAQIREEAQLKKQQTFYRTLIIISILLSIIIFIGLLYSRARARNVNFKLQNKLLEERLETRNKELTNRIMALIQRNELEKEIVQKLNSLRPKMKIENQDDINQIINDLSYKQNDQLWKEFEVRFENVHQEFYSKLSEKYPDLTTNEKRLCAFLYLDMSSKDISAITGQSIRALNVARTRLRKKFELTNSQQSLSSHLNSI